MVSQCTKFEVSGFTRCEAVNGGAKCRKWDGLLVVRGHSRSWAMPPFDRALTTSYSTLIETMCLSFTVSGIAGYLSKVTDFDPLHLHLVPPAEIFGIRKLESLGYRVVFLCDPTFSRFSGTPTCGRQTQIQTQGHRAVKTPLFCPDIIQSFETQPSRETSDVFDFFL